MQHSQTVLTDQQLQALDLLVRGMPTVRIAKTLGISRDTLWRWRQQPHFTAAFQQRRSEQYDCLQEQAAELLRLSMLSLTRELSLADDPRMRNPLATAFQALDFIHKTGLLHEMPRESPAAAMGEAVQLEARIQEISASNASFVSE